MKITGFELFVVGLPNRRHHTWASKMTAAIGRHVLIRIDTDEGISGWGESPAGITWGGSQMRYYGESPDSISQSLTTSFLSGMKTDVLVIANS